MQHSQTRRLLALLLALMTLIGPVSVKAAGDSGETDDAGGLVTKSEDLIFISYQDYLVKYLDVPDSSYIDDALEQARGTKTFSFSAADYVKEDTTSEVEAVDHNGRKGLSKFSVHGLPVYFMFPHVRNVSCLCSIEYGTRTSMGEPLTIIRNFHFLQFSGRHSLTFSYILSTRALVKG